MTQTYGAFIEGFNARLCTATVELHMGPSIVTGMPERSASELRHRLKSAVCQLEAESISYALTLEPAAKGGCTMDLAALMALLAQVGLVRPSRLEGWLFYGEVGLDGSIRAVPGGTAVAELAVKHGLKLMVSSVLRDESMPVRDSEVYCADKVTEALHLLSLPDEELYSWRGVAYEPYKQPIPYVDLAHIKGNVQARRALEIAAAGGFPLMFTGLPGTGKTLLARALPGILPPMTYEERLEVGKLHSIAGLSRGMVKGRPFRAPHHTASEAALVGGGVPAMPGEVSLAHRGVLFIDEAAEFRRASLDALRTPLLYGEAQLAKATYPSKFRLVMATHTCPCGYHGDTRCRCTDAQIEAYRRRLDIPLVKDHVYLFAETAPVNAVTTPLGEATEVVQARVIKARALLVATPNNTSFSRVLLVARTIAALEGCATPTKEHVAEARSFCTNPFTGEIA